MVRQDKTQVEIQVPQLADCVNVDSCLNLSEIPFPDLQTGGRNGFHQAMEKNTNSVTTLGSHHRMGTVLLQEGLGFLYYILKCPAQFLSHRRFSVSLQTQASVSLDPHFLIYDMRLSD